ncbi:uncharacterized protein OCT59_005933 [Rhizophagus irregularis]|uniref:F-box domain-containing protein n=1 Tax=Rhizophagus irregularis (strain DAOM 181602 / DAOM 197198 / MUCL 43194) TaxID=747089 RepID=A0A2P4QH94_RHIID|nr:hypothetical protein GLOIN_2v1768272 [Rhizophagus irregularis DAOM 181602=DAOM 197198]POG77015.1 hypothetical protein GLOIN_2v1768272 [Rhizophagus irregularis DAOM 181602=DAOM 197198]UZO14476.1 hypothetical protein OCT59_005933 [Rhizophagus irregularis]|eukprot:XP_025183881.1 hypothetical protein GLOIN_2v1768272 [Rhizophagus irregularis DAOM 181602=DAOM 197198]
MACSKVLLGNLPELTEDIIQYFRDDISTLHSCILVNKFWCQITIPLLWKDPFSMKNPKNLHFIEIYLQKINEKDKEQLNRCGINNNVFPSKTLFNYSYFIKLFIENEVKLKTFEIEISYNYLMNKRNFNKIFRLILQNPKFISNIKNLKLHFDKEIVKYKFDYNFLKCFYHHCNLISSLHIRFSEYESFRNNHITIENQLSQIINSQKNLEKIIFKLDNSTSTNNNISLYNIIESIHILECLIFNSNFIQQIIDLNKFKLTSLFIRDETTRDKNLQIELMQLLFQKFGEYLENIGFGSYVDDVLKYRALEFINNYCKKIKFFDTCSISSVKKVHIALDSVGQNLNYFSIYIFYNHDENYKLTMEMILRLAHVLPCKLEYLNLSFTGTPIRKNIWEVFFKSLGHIFIKKLLFRINNLFDHILPYIKEYIMKEKRVEYLAIEAHIEIQVGSGTYNIYRHNKELFTMTDELKEFESYNIKVREYSDLCIRAYEFIDEMY